MAVKINNLLKTLVDSTCFQTVEFHNTKPRNLVDVKLYAFNIQEVIELIENQ